MCVEMHPRWKRSPQDSRGINSFSGIASRQILHSTSSSGGFWLSSISYCAASSLAILSSSSIKRWDSAKSALWSFLISSEFCLSIRSASARLTSSPVREFFRNFTPSISMLSVKSCFSFSFSSRKSICELRFFLRIGSMLACLKLLNLVLASPMIPRYMLLSTSILWASEISPALNALKTSARKFRMISRLKSNFMFCLVAPAT
mmetsp:Transcript_7994/g.15722  ORF Transcript_7994/g.15722 Transcript_7994/m.15722 type:complete len:204 (-) Transcript_7994:329-940(-)